MGKTRRKALRRLVTVVTSTIAIVLASASAAFAFDSPGKPPATGDQTITWTGQGATNGVLNTSLCSAADDPFGENQPYLLWILDTDHGSVTTGPTTPDLHLSGSAPAMDYFQSAPFTSNNVHIVTPYYTPDSSLLANASMNITDVGTGNWQLVISHGCAGNTPPPPAGALTATKTANGNYDTTYAWDIAKAADKTEIDTSDGNATFHYTVTVHHDGGTPSGWRVTGNIDVHNPNSADANITGVTDTLSDGTSCTVDLSNGLTVPANGDTIYPYSCSLSGQPSAPLNNDATVTWPDQPLAGTSGLAGGSADAIVNGISFTQDKVFDGQVSVTDTLGGDLGTVGFGDPNPTYFTYDHTFSGDPAATCTSHDNTATFTTNTSASTGSASETVKQCVGADLTVSKTAVPSFDRTYAWNIQKAVDKTKVEQVGGSATFNYTVTVGHDSGTDGNWKVKGIITVSNPNDWEPVTVTGLQDAIDNGGICSLDNALPQGGASIPAKGSQDFPYTCAYGSAPSRSDFTNTATASWDASAASTPDGSADGAAGGIFADPNIVDGSVAVNDTLGGSLGTVGLGDPNPKSFTYSNTVSVPQFNCVSVNNTATFKTSDTGTTGSDSKTVQVCGPAKTGALTIGFWKTTNGQNLIKTYCTSGSGNLGTYLAGLGTPGPGPFSNAPTSCSTLASYVSTILTGASATNMNSMLKAQMLGTSLDVWFSGPGWTSTAKSGIKPPSNFLSHNSLGSFNMDTTAVCPMVDNLSTGTATCQNSTPSTDAVQAGAVPTSPMSMQAILDYAATTPSPFNGLTSASSVWYGGNKTKEEVLKNIFDQFNNQLAFGSF
jgi:hypothetical protein